jgi:hypothetical protein
MASTKQSTKTKRACFQCDTETCNFHLPCNYRDGTTTQRTPKTWLLYINWERILLDPERKTKWKRCAKSIL